MTKEEIAEGNKLIAKFMGGKFTLIKSHTPNVSFKQHPRQDRNFNNVSDTNLHPKLLAYHKSWDWLMPVCKKIASEDDVMRYKVGELISNCRFQISDVFKSIVEHVKRKNNG